MFQAVKKIVLEFSLILAVCAIVHFALMESIYFVINILKRKNKSPNKAWIICILDVVLSYAQKFQIGHFKTSNDILSAIQSAQKSTGLQDLGGSDGGKQMIRRYQICREKGLDNFGGKLIYSPVGFVGSKELLTKRMEVRLKLVDYLKKHPQIEIQESNSIKKPIIIIGFPRTGTTFLHELLGLHPKTRSHCSWQQMEPVPRTHIETTEALQNDLKLRYNDIYKRLRLKFLLQVAGERIQYIHRIGYDEPEECTLPCAVELPWSLLELPLNVFAAKELIEFGGKDAYEFYKKYLKLLSWSSSDVSNCKLTNGVREDDGIRWMLKCPLHLPYLEDLHQSFPDSVLVWTHRDPVECIASACSLYELSLHMAFESETVNKIALGKAVVDFSKRSLDKALESLKKIPNNIIHIRYADNIKNPKNICKQIVEQADMEFSDDFQKKIDDYLQKSYKKRDEMKGSNKKVLHEYNLEEYGLSEQYIKDVFKDYIKMFNLSEN